LAVGYSVFQGVASWWTEYDGYPTRAFCAVPLFQKCVFQAGAAVATVEPSWNGKALEMFRQRAPCPPLFGCVPPPIMVCSRYRFALLFPWYQHARRDIGFGFYKVIRKKGALGFSRLILSLLSSALLSPLSIPGNWGWDLDWWTDRQASRLAGR
jgi:hypothetical protein